MGNCQAVDAAALVIQHPNGKIERWYWPISATEVMKMNPGHYVSLIIPLPTPPSSSTDVQGSKVDKLASTPLSSLERSKTVRYTRVKLLRPTDTLVLGRAYRLVTSQEVMKVVQAKKQAKMKKIERESSKKSLSSSSQLVSHNSSRRRQEDRNLELDPSNQVVENEREQEGMMTQQSTTNSAVVGRSKSWRPSLQSISESES